MEYIEAVLNQMVFSGITIPALMIGYYLTYHRFSTVILPLALYGVVDHILVRLLYIFEIQQGTFSQFGTKITQLDWVGIMLTNAWQDVLAFFIVGFVIFSLCKLVKKFKK
jgi:large-conductance mechanosensitive channel